MTKDMRQFISVSDVPDIDALVEKARAYKKDPWADQGMGARKRIGCLFFNPSTRTRLSTQVAAQQLGMECIVFNMGGEGWTLEFDDEAVMNGTTVEHVREAAPILGQYFDILAIRTFPGLKDRASDYAEYQMSKFIEHAGIPVVSLESATLHPLQSLADLVTIRECMEENPEQHGRKPKVVLTWAPHVKPLPQCVANSFAQWMNAWGGADFTIAHPEGLDLDESFTRGANVVNDQEEALKDADFVYVKNWSGYRDYGKVLSSDPTWMLTRERLRKTRNARVMHCLPVRRNVELGAEVLDGPDSLVIRQASNRVWAAQAVLASILETGTSKT
jgi:N-succinyl-L-ornithine transcarbamylase